MGLDIADLGDSLTYGRLLTILRGLPRDSAFAMSVLGEAGTWSQTDHLLAAVVDQLAVVSWQLQGDRRAARPQPLPRPGERRPKLGPERLRAKFIEILRRREAANG